MSGLTPATPDHCGGPASVARLVTAAVLLALAVSACGTRHQTSEERLAAAWTPVQAQFDRLGKFELDFRVGAAAAIGKVDAEKVRFVQDALDRRSALQIGLKTELRRFTRAAASEPASARSPYIIKVNLAMDKLKTIENESLPAVKALQLGKHEAELSAYQAEKDAALRRAR